MMIKKILFALCAGTILLTSTICYAASRYWVNGGVNNNWSTSGNWSASSGGAGGETVPTSADAVFLDNAVACTVDASASCASIDCTGYTGGLTLNAGFNSAGSINFVAGMTFTPNSQTATISGTGNLTSAGKTFYNLTLSGAITTTHVGAALNINNVLTLANASTLTGSGTTLSLLNTTGTTDPFVMNTGTISIANFTFYNATASSTVNIPVTGTWGITNHTTFYSTVAGAVFSLQGNLSSGTVGQYLQLLADNTKNLTFNTNNYIFTSSTTYLEIGHQSYTGSTTINLGTSTSSFTYITLGGTGGGSHSITCGAAAIDIGGGATDFAKGTGTISLTDTGATWTNNAAGMTLDGNSQTFNNFIIDGGGTITETVTIGNNFTINAGKTLQITSGKTLTVAGTFNAQGTAGSPITIKAVTGGSRANLPVTTLGTVTYVTATDIDSSGGVAIMDTNGTLSNTVNWTTRAGKASMVTTDF